MKLKKGDKVQVILGKDRGKSGNVEKVDKAGHVFIANVNVSKRHVRGQGQIEGGIIDIIKPLKVSNVALVCPKCGKATRVGYLIDKEGKKRICRKCKELI
jgi:large subunit ribosomal protein L24